MKITEKMLLDGYDGISKDGITAQSVVSGQRIWWVYRHNNGEGANVTEIRKNAHFISLENGRTGEIELDEDCENHMATAKLYDDAHKIWGDKI